MISKRYVQPSKTDAGWEVLKEGHRRATVHAPTRAQAMAQARTLTRRDGGGEIRVRDRTGKVSESITVAHGTPSRSRR
jgi:hypothetical protein